MHILATHLAIILAFALPALLLRAPWHSLLVRLALNCHAGATGLGLLALLARHPWPRRSLCLWDEIAALFALALLCGALARRIIPV